MSFFKKIKEERKKHKKAFTLIELSVVLILIGLVVSGIVGGQSLIQSAQLAKARNLTNSAPVMTIEGLTLWLESTTDTQ